MDARFLTRVYVRKQQQQYGTSIPGTELTTVFAVYTVSHPNPLLFCQIITVHHGMVPPPKTQATVGGSPFGPFISVARGHLRELLFCPYAILRFLHVLH